MANHCKCFHALWQHDFDQGGACTVESCYCKQYSYAGIATTQDIIDESARAWFNPHDPIPQSQRKHGLCPRCKTEHYLDLHGIANFCTAVQSIGMDSQGRIISIDFFQIDPLAPRKENAMEYFPDRIKQLDMCYCGHDATMHDDNGADVLRGPCRGATVDGTCDCRLFSKF